MKVFILGKGFIGSKLDVYLRSKNIDSFLFSKSELDYTNQISLSRKIWDDHPPDIIINASGYTGIPNIDAAEYDKENCWKYNVMVPVTIHNVCMHAKIPLIHISSGCIYNDYTKEYTEEDTPNFGLFTNDSSFYSKTKHAAETLMPEAYHYRIRMPFTSEPSKRNYFDKIFGYNKLITSPNSMTSLEDLCEFIHNSLNKVRNGIIMPGKFNVVNPGIASAEDIITKMAQFSDVVRKSDWKFISAEELKTKAKRSNCKISSKKIESVGLGLPSLEESLDAAIKRWVKLKFSF